MVLYMAKLVEGEEEEADKEEEEEEKADEEEEKEEEGRKDGRGLETGKGIAVLAREARVAARVEVCNSREDAAQMRLPGLATWYGS